jgi:glucose/arabinose dehydrogenase
MQRVATNLQFLLRCFVMISCTSILVLAGFASNTPVLAAPSLKDTNLRIDTVATGLSRPTSMAFLGLNDLLVLEENTGLVKRIKNNVVLSAPLLDLNVATNDERGLLGIDVKRRGGSTTQFDVYLYYTAAAAKDGGAVIGNRLSKYILTIDPRLGPAQGRMSHAGTLLDLPATPSTNHNGGKVAIGPDSNVYTVIGDLGRSGQAQNVQTGGAPDGTGGILRVTQSGATVGSGLLGSGSPLNKYFAYGIRNSFGVDFDPLTGKLWDTENGPDKADEINLVDPGFNSGWIDIMGFPPSGFNFNNLVNFGGKGKYSDPEFVWTKPVAPTAIEFFTTNKLGSAYHNDMFVGDYINGRIYDFNLNSGRTALVLSGVLADKIANPDSETLQVIFGQGFGGITDLKVGIGDGYLYVLSLGAGAVYKVLPKSAATSTIASDDISTAEEEKSIKAREKSKISKQDNQSSTEKREQQIKERAENLLEKQQREQQMQDEQEEQEQQEQREFEKKEQQNDMANSANQTMSAQQAPFE